MMASAQVVETSVNTNNSPSQDYTTNLDDHSNHNYCNVNDNVISHCHQQLENILLNMNSCIHFIKFETEVDLSEATKQFFGLVVCPYA